MLIKQGNGVRVRISRVKGGEVTFDLRKSGPSHRRASSSEDSLYQNLTIKEAKKLCKALKAAIEGDPV